ncbi:hypothetical protein AMAG_10391 [Allomyces macrogynus ATCC 38327]|uniref:Uncharacterized protein n=1 Tax=Allomyces macrogynus (strain ATCC 38327) TaxID=578462 RepID=A0A0L0SUJ7_ALLM3|nr:hypothetical protein AMAG_10391 [Allomyces macrogynus ATCC 38327]|eukprot:KNE66141.1 hypothetical protein AMAG_10391 [Allomyces macrogynus ATCC 38327]
MSKSQAIELRAVAPTTSDLAKRLALFFAAGAVLGTAFDGLHANHDILAYLPDEIAFWKLAWWVPPEFGAGGLLLGLAPHYMPRQVFASLASPRGSFHPSARIAWTQLATALVGYGLSSLVPYHLQWPTNTVSVLLGAIFLATWALTNGRIMALVACLVVGVSGSVWEATLCALGRFWYVSPDALGAGYVTHWIVWLWAGAALGGVHLASVYIARPVIKQA